ncbi:alternative oxidase AlxA [Angomonas deanei]|uniref:Alternative oxidase n=1 Tax=Angomonas deanei TaxID=59799 RepID=S9WHD1_9TRYP|nr:alternative oxidase [Angomonas deanei]EPY38651.1 alternative oxidase AlxA [Angomonas deanei]CAD2214068.1 Alternative oxidase, putative [Angomonas deanei]|eukprot:EPY32125.1 alternative oxidase [Angomonas deanei]
MFPLRRQVTARLTTGFTQRGFGATTLRCCAATQESAIPQHQWGSRQLNQLSFLSFAKRLSTKEHVEIAENSYQTSQWDLEDARNVRVTHKEPEGMADRLAYGAVSLCRWGFDTFSLYRFGTLTERKVVNRCLFLETVAGVPGMVGGMLRHMTSLRRMEADLGWIQTLLEEAENERMHLMTFVEIRQPGLVFRGCILVAQGIMFNLLLALYIVSPRFVHRFVGYLEEQAVITYTDILGHIEKGELQFSATRVPPLAITYWGLDEKASFHDLINAIRADEAEHRVVNHTFADMHSHNLCRNPNPFAVLKQTDSK